MSKAKAPDKSRYTVVYLDFTDQKTASVLANQFVASGSSITFLNSIGLPFAFYSNVISVTKQ